jgi:uncharacterized protein (DUF302 family)
MKLYSASFSLLTTSAIAVRAFSPKPIQRFAVRQVASRFVSLRPSAMNMSTTNSLPEYGSPSYGITKKLPAGTNFSDAITKVTEALKDNGFGVLTEIDMQATMKKRLDVDLGRPYKILGACSPKLALKALQNVPAVGLFLPCNVAVAEDPDGRVVVSIISPEAMFSIAAQDKNQSAGGVEELAKEVQVVMEKVMNAL